MAPRGESFVRLLLHVKTIDVFLIAQVEFPIRDHRMSPDAAARAAVFAKWRQLKPPTFFPSVGARIDQADRPIPFVDAIELAIGKADGPLAKLPALIPDFFARCEVLADPADFV